MTREDRLARAGERLYAFMTWLLVLAALALLAAAAT